MDESTDRLISAKQTAAILDCSTPLVYKMADRGQLKCVRWACPGDGKKKSRSMVKFKIADILAFIEEHHG